MIVETVANHSSAVQPNNPAVSVSETKPGSGAESKADSKNEARVDVRPAGASPVVARWERFIFGCSWRKTHLLVPGVLLALAVMLVADSLAMRIGQALAAAQGAGRGARPSGISGITCAIVLGLLISNFLQVRPTFRAGLEFSVRKLLRFGIILVGIRLSFLDVVQMGSWGIPVVLTVIVCALVLTGWFTKWLGLSSRLGTLAAASTAICGVTAALAVAPTIDANDEEVAYTVANVTLFGMVAMLTYPYLAHWIFSRQHAAAGLFLGTAIHDTSQVMGAALSYNQLFGDEAAMKVATMTKLTRNVFLLAVVPYLAFQAARQEGRERKRVSLAKLFPIFVLGFAGMAVIRSIGDAGLVSDSHLAFGVLTGGAWASTTKFFGEGLSYHALGAAMAAVGLSTDMKAFRGLGLKPLYVGATAATIVGGVGLALAAVIGPKIDARLVPAPVIPLQTIAVAGNAIGAPAAVPPVSPPTEADDLALAAAKAALEGPGADDRTPRTGSPGGDEQAPAATDEAGLPAGTVPSPSQPSLRPHHAIKSTAHKKRARRGHHKRAKHTKSPHAKH